MRDNDKMVQKLDRSKELDSLLAGAFIVVVPEAYKKTKLRMQ